MKYETRIWFVGISILISLICIHSLPTTPNQNFISSLVKRISSGNIFESLTPYYSCNVLKTSIISPWISCTNGKLSYTPINQRGDYLPDFSWAGYGGGGVPIPNVSPSITLSPKGNGSDDAPQIQGALDSLGRIQPINGIRGAVLLTPGVFNIGQTIYISNSGVILKGSGDGTVLNVIVPPTQLDSATLIVVSGSNQYTFTASSNITNTYLPVRSSKITIVDGSLFKAGDTVIVERPISKSWIKFMGMDNLVRDGKPQVGWGSGSGTSRTDRNVIAVQGNQITLDAPLTDAYNISFGTCILRKYSSSLRIQNVGIENLRARAPFLNGKITESQYVFAKYDNLIDGWLRNIATLDMNNGFVKLMKYAKRVTVQNINIGHSGTLDHSNGYPSDIQVLGTQLLIDNVLDTGSSIYYLVTQAWTNGPNVFRNIRTNAPSNQGTGIGKIAPHQRWATGTLFENITMINGAIEIVNRGTDGTGQGWSGGYNIIWNTNIGSYSVQNPPGAWNLCVGCTGNVKSTSSKGTYSNLNQRVWPDSLYFEQLSMRLGRKVGP